ncbi:Thyrotropin-releasing hormone receptor [Eumeta japonica]|uniref:Thyrotropin-releasing hormone receptor n=1 Tax=Eumeta variegata TaxID=151549 RepID=A0A4C1UK53_EUMVA|nr:Thyrotropin-releasing hormone receptor [Eumeta japonica]
MLGLKVVNRRPAPPVARRPPPAAAQCGAVVFAGARARRTAASRLRCYRPENFELDVYVAAETVTAHTAAAKACIIDIRNDITSLALYLMHIVVSFVLHSPILGVATFTYEEYSDGSVEPVCLTQADTFWSALFFILTIALFFIVPLAVLLVLYSVIAKNLMENPVIIAQNSKNGQNTNILRYRKQVILMLGTVVLSFFVCLLPFKALTLWIIVFPPETIMSLGIDGYYILLYFCRVMLYLNSAINPILYNLMSSKFRDGFVKLLKINKLVRCGRSLRENIQRRDTLNTTTSTGFSSSQNTSDSFWRRYSRTSSQKNIINRIESGRKKTKDTIDNNVQQIRVGEIINVENTRRNSMKIIAAMAEDADLRVELHEPAESAGESPDSKQIQILNLDVKTNSVYSITLDLSEEGDGKNRFVCVPVHKQDGKNRFVYDFSSKESFV